MNASHSAIRHALSELHKSTMELYGLEWFNTRNQFLYDEGIGGIMVDGSKELLPDFLESDSIFWFADVSSELAFILKWL